MTDCQLWEGDKQISLYYLREEDPTPAEEVRRCLKALKELEPVVQPLSVEFGVKYRHKKTLALKRDYRDRPKFPYWHWEISSVPPDIVTEGFHFGGAKVIPVKDITTKDLSKWIVEPLQQKSPDPKYDVWWSEINICATKARIINPTVIDEIRCVKRDYYLVKTAIGELRYPLVRQDNSLWVCGPHERYRGYPPMTITILTLSGRHDINFFIPWTVWYDEYSPEYFCFYQAIQRIIAQGWQLSEKTPLEKPKYAA